MLSQVVQDALNKQINMEFSSSYSLLGNVLRIASLNNFVGSANWMRLQSQEEHSHAMKLYNFLMPEVVRLHLLRFRSSGPSSSPCRMCFSRLSSRSTRSVSQSTPCTSCSSEKAFATLVELQWFITEASRRRKDGSRDCGQI